MITNLEDGTITFCDHDTLLIYVGGHIPTGIIKAMKVMSVAGAYWRGDEKQAINSCLWNIVSKQKD
jgi:threonyl-tRNA synthetase